MGLVGIMNMVQLIYDKDVCCGVVWLVFGSQFFMVIGFCILVDSVKMFVDLCENVLVICKDQLLMCGIVLFCFENCFGIEMLWIIQDVWCDDVVELKF